MNVYVFFGLLNLGLGLVFRSLGGVSFPQFTIALFFFILAFFNIGG